MRPIHLAGVALLMMALGGRALADDFAWHTQGVQTRVAYSVKGATEPDAGMVVDADGAALGLKLASGTSYSAVVFSQRVDFTPDGVVGIELSELQGDMSLQLICFDTSGTYLASVDLLKGVTAKGKYEIPFRIYRSGIPAKTDRVAFKLWLGGGEKALAQVAALAYGADNAPVPPAPAAPKLFTPPAPGAKSPWNIPGPAPHILTHYIPWYTTPTADKPDDWKHWKFTFGPQDHDPAKTLSDGRRDIASVLYPLIGPYHSAERNVIRYHLATAKAAGIQGFLVLWYGPDSETNQCVPAILDEAEKLNMRVAICYEEKLNWPTYRQPKNRADMVASATSDLNYVLTHYATHPAYLKRNGVPFIQQFNYWGASEMGPRYFTPDEWADIFAGLKGPVSYMRQNLDEMFYPRINASYHWWSDNSSALNQYSDRAQSLVDKGQMEYFMTIVGVGFNDTAVWGWGAGPRKSKQFGPEVIDQTFELAVRNRPELIQVVTWNDFNESTCFEPTLGNGTKFLDRLETLIGQKFHRPVDLSDNMKPFEEYVKSCSAEQRALLPK